MQKKQPGNCPVQGGVPYSILIEYKEAKTQEGTDYAKGDFVCEHNKAHNTCQMSDCPIWMNASNEP